MYASLKDKLLKQAPQAWNSKIDLYFQHFGLQQSPSEPSLYVKVRGNENFLIVCLYSHDMIYVGTDMKMVKDFKRSMMKEFGMTDLNLMKYFLGIQDKQSSGKIFISWENHLDDLLKKF
ncbi:Retrovirus-related Pol polyprotein from transposon TNT 1-94 [Gossypium australe]|uniref:Retrovirus-related Pol polyprotein from transposon TNT 1-94 n=1 Tax=Gossypium australe TaxID=47621 RepID=A0A5B6VYE7_9ROSI|nr:Retrovirus-related Pol polyprotein from transposon TNT 1-94 [Gossypium australe]